MTWQKTLEQAATSRQYYDVFRDFITVVACALSPRQFDKNGSTVSVREAEYLEVVSRYEKPQVEHLQMAYHQLVETMQTGEPYLDHLGKAYMESMPSNRRGGEFYTPPEIGKLMAALSFDKSLLEREEPIDVHEPASGSGVMLLGLAHHLAETLKVSPLVLRVQAWDKDRNAANMCFINTTLWGIPAEVVHGNTLTLETYAIWRNLFWPMARALKSAGASKPPAALPKGPLVQGSLFGDAA